MVWEGGGEGFGMRAVEGKRNWFFGRGRESEWGGWKLHIYIRRR